MTWHSEARLRRTRGMSRTNVLKRAEVDLETWAALDKIRFQFDVTGVGEAIWGPTYFGRAYDSPPFFTHSFVATDSYSSGPRVTVGVSDWIQDEKDMYVGVNLFVRLDSTFPCFNRRIAGQVLNDPGFETQIATHTGGPVGDEIPEYHTSIEGLRWESDGSPSAADKNVWFQSPLTNNPDKFFIDTANPRTGTYHIRQRNRDGSKSQEAQTTCIWKTDTICDRTDGIWLVRQYSARVTPGDVVTFGGYFTASDPGDPTPASVVLGMGAQTQSGGFKGGATGGFANLTTSYQLVETDPFLIPADAYHVNTQFLFQQNSSIETYFDGDDMFLDIVGVDSDPVGDSFDAGRYRVNVNFEGQHLKSYAVVHKLHELEAPTNVVLT